jgi:hypothetical protein
MDVSWGRSSTRTVESPTLLVTRMPAVGRVAVEWVGVGQAG